MPVGGDRFTSRPGACRWGGGGVGVGGVVTSSQWAICRATPWASYGVRGRDQNILKPSCLVIFQCSGDPEVGCVSSVFAVFSSTMTAGGGGAGVWAGCLTLEV